MFIARLSKPQRIAVFAVIIAAASRLSAATSDPPPLPTPGPAPAQSPTSPNEALAAFAKEIIIKSLKPQYEKRENWGHQTTVVDGFHWVQHDGGWHLDKQTKPVNDGLWRMYSVRFNDPERNLQLRLTPAHPAENGRTAFQAYLTAADGGRCPPRTMAARRQRFELSSARRGHG